MNAEELEFGGDGAKSGTVKTQSPWKPIPGIDLTQKLEILTSTITKNSKELKTSLFQKIDQLVPGREFKNRLCSSLVLACPDCTKKFLLNVD